MNYVNTKSRAFLPSPFSLNVLSCVKWPLTWVAPLTCSGSTGSAANGSRLTCDLFGDFWNCNCMLASSWKISICKTSCTLTCLYAYIDTQTGPLLGLFSPSRKSPWSPSTLVSSWWWRVESTSWATNSPRRWSVRAKPSLSSWPTTAQLSGRLQTNIYI